MEDQSARAARLRAMREAAGLGTRDQDTNGAAQDTTADEPVLKFRNYSVKDDKITHEKQAVANPPKYEQPSVEPDIDVEGEVGSKRVVAFQAEKKTHNLLSASLLLAAGAAAECCTKKAKLGFAQRR